MWLPWNLVLRWVLNIQSQSWVRSKGNTVSKKLTCFCQGRHRFSAVQLPGRSAHPKDVVHRPDGKHRESKDFHCLLNVCSFHGSLALAKPRSFLSLEKPLYVLPVPSDMRNRFIFCFRKKYVWLNYTKWLWTTLLDHIFRL